MLPELPLVPELLLVTLLTDDPDAVLLRTLLEATPIPSLIVLPEVSTLVPQWRPDVLMSPCMCPQHGS